MGASRRQIKGVGGGPVVLGGSDLLQLLGSSLAKASRVSDFWPAGARNRRTYRAGFISTFVFVLPYIVLVISSAYQ